MFPESNAPEDSQAWVRDISHRADANARKASLTESNAYALAQNIKTNYELIDSRIANLTSFTRGLFSQRSASNSVSGYTSLSAVPLLYSYTSGDYLECAAEVARVPYAQFNDLSVSANSLMSSYTTSSAATNIQAERGLRPMITATIPPLGSLSAAGVLNPNALNYASRWTVENFEQFLDYDMPGNQTPARTATADYYYAPVAQHPISGGSPVEISFEGHSNYTMRYLRADLLEYMDAIRDYAERTSPLPSGTRYLAPDVNQVEIIVGWYYRAYTGGTFPSSLALNDPRLVFEADMSASFEGIKNMGY